MLIRIGYELVFDCPSPAPMLFLLRVHPSRDPDICEERLEIEPSVPITEFLDGFGNRCGRVVAPAGEVRLRAAGLVRDSGEPDSVQPAASQVPIEDLPYETLPFLLNSRYCEVDKLGDIAWDLFGSTTPGWGRVQAICDWVHGNVQFGYGFARPTKSAFDVYQERAGVCRDFAHLALTFCRCMNIPARYATGYLGDIGVPPQPHPMDFSGWFEAFLGDRWYTFDARHNQPRVGRILMARGRDATDTALTTAFGTANLLTMAVVTEEVAEYSTLNDT